MPPLPVTGHTYGGGARPPPATCHSGRRTSGRRGSPGKGAMRARPRRLSVRAAGPSAQGLHHSAQTKVEGTVGRAPPHGGRVLAPKAPDVPSNPSRAPIRCRNSDALNAPTPPPPSRGAGPQAWDGTQAPRAGGVASRGQAGISHRAGPRPGPTNRVLRRLQTERRGDGDVHSRVFLPQRCPGRWSQVTRGGAARPVRTPGVRPTITPPHTHWSQLGSCSPAEGGSRDDAGRVAAPEEATWLPAASLGTCLSGEAGRDHRGPHRTGGPSLCLQRATDRPGPRRRRRDRGWGWGEEAKGRPHEPHLRRR